MDFFLIFTETDADSGVDESTQNGTSPNKPNGSGNGSRIPKKTPPATPHKSRGRSSDEKPGVQRRPVRSKSVPKPFTSFTLAAPIIDDAAPPKKGMLLTTGCGSEIFPLPKKFCPNNFQPLPLHKNYSKCH